MAVADAAEAQRAPVILGFSGIYLPHPERCAADPLAAYASMALAVCRSATVPAALLFNELPNRAWVSDAIRLGFNAVMYSDDAENGPAARDAIAALVDEAHAAGAAVEAEMDALPGVAGGLNDADVGDLRLTDPDSASAFVEDTRIDALAVNVGQKHLHGRSTVRLDLRLVQALAGLSVPLVLHGGSSVEPGDLIEFDPARSRQDQCRQPAEAVLFRRVAAGSNRCGGTPGQSLRDNRLGSCRRRADARAACDAARSRTTYGALWKQRESVTMRHPIVIPHLGATGGDVRIVSWEAKENQKVRAGEILFTVETDKAVTEIPAFRDGVLVAISAAAGQDYAPGTVVAHLAEEEAAPAAIEKSPSTSPVGGQQKTRVRVRTDSPSDTVNLPELLLEAYATMTLIRRYEEHLYNLFLQGLVPGTLHQCQGQEAVAVGVCSALRTDDVIYSTHRPVGHLIAKGASLDAITAEIWGKATGCVGGKGGQMHLADFSVGAMVTNAIVGANIPIATGSAMAFRMLGLDRVAVSFFGDGASNIGAFHEGLNLAAVKRAPAVFVCENNLYAASTHISLSSNITDIADRAASYGMPGVVIDGMDVEAVYAATSKAVARARHGDGPTLIECKTYRYRGHSRGDPGGYRRAEEHDAWVARDPIERTKARLVQRFAMPPERLAEIDRQAQAKVEAAVAFALSSPEPQPSDVTSHVFAD